MKGEEAVVPVLTPPDLGSFNDFPRELYPLLIGFLTTSSNLESTCKTIHRIINTISLRNLIRTFEESPSSLLSSISSPIRVLNNRSFLTNFNFLQDKNHLQYAFVVLLFPSQFNQEEFGQAIQWAEEESKKNTKFEILFHSLQATKRVRDTIKEKKLDVLKELLLVPINKVGYINFSGAECEGVELEKDLHCYVKYVNFKGANFYKASFKGTQLREVNLSGANLCGVDFSNACLQNINLRGANLSGANLSRAMFIGADLCGANFHKATAHFACLGNNKFCNADLSEADFSRAQLNGSNLRGAKCYKTNFSETQVYEVDFRGADLIGAEITPRQMLNAIFDDTTQMDPDLREKINIIKGAEAIEQAFLPRPG